MNPTRIGLGSNPEIRGEMPVWNGTASSYQRKDKGKGKDKVVPAHKHYTMKAAGRVEKGIHAL
jgi:hypothetical protein